MTTLRVGVALAAAIVVAGCSSGGSGGTTTPTRLPESFARMDANGDVLANAFANLSVRTAPSALPRSGTARYEGYADIDPTPGGTILGQMNMDVNFGTNRVSGEVVNMRTASSALGGRITMTDGRINRSAGTANAAFSLDLGGNVVSNNGTSSVRGDLDGQFANNGRLVGGRGNGTFNRGTTRTPFDIQVVGER